MSMNSTVKERRFEFGRNWKRFLEHLDEERIKTAESSLTEMLKTDNFKEKTFLDIGSGSGIFSLAARRLGATVYSFDYDKLAVSCAEQLCSRYFPDRKGWSIMQGSVLDKQFLRSLGTFDIVYAWGVLHHTGDMWNAMDYIAGLVNQNGILFVAIYNDKGAACKFWRMVKATYCSSVIGKAVICGIFIPVYIYKTVIKCIRLRENLFLTYKKNRGMSIVHDWFDWLGGFPYEVAKPQDVVQFYEKRGFAVKKLKLNTRLGNNQFVFIKK